MKSFVTILTGLFIAAHGLAQQHSFSFEARWIKNDTTKPQIIEPVTLEMLNCKPGVYRTYEDFKNQTPEDLSYVEIVYTGMVQINSLLVVFKDKNGKKVKLSPNDFWGWKTQTENKKVLSNAFFRNATFNTGGITAIPFYVIRVSDYVHWVPTRDANNVIFNPSDWISFDLKSPLMEESEFRRMCKNTLKKVDDCCDQKCPHRKYYVDNHKLRACHVNNGCYRIVYTEQNKGDKNKTYTSRVEE